MTNLTTDGKLIKTNRYVIGISTNSDPIIDKYNFNKSLQKSLIFIPTYYGASLNFLKKS